MDDNSNSGVKINLISSRKLDSMTSQEKLRFILDEVKRGTVLVLERGLTAVEEIDLIKATMSEINHETFIGIEMQSYSSRDLAAESWFSRVLGRTRVPKMSVIGPANLLKTIHKNGNIIQAMILTGESITREIREETKPEGELLLEGEEVSPEDSETPEPGPESPSEDAPVDAEYPPADQEPPSEQVTRSLPIKGPPREYPPPEYPPPPAFPVEEPPMENEQTEPEYYTNSDQESPVAGPAEPVEFVESSESTTTAEPEAPPAKELPPSGADAPTAPPADQGQGTSFLYRRLKEEEE